MDLIKALRLPYTTNKDALRVRLANLLPFDVGDEKAMNDFAYSERVGTMIVSYGLARQGDELQYRLAIAASPEAVYEQEAVLNVFLDIFGRHVRPQLIALYNQQLGLPVKLYIWPAEQVNLWKVAA